MSFLITIFSTFLLVFMNVNLTFANSDIEAKQKALEVTLKKLADDLAKTEGITNEEREEVLFLYIEAIRNGKPYDNYNYENIKNAYFKLKSSKELCSKKNYSACKDVGYVYGSEFIDYKNSYNYFNIACNGGDLVGCINLAHFHNYDTIFPKDYDKSLSLYQKACDGGYDIGCNSFKDLYNKVCLTNPKKYCSKYE